MTKINSTVLSTIILYIDSVTTLRTFIKISRHTLKSISVLQNNPIHILRYIPFLFEYSSNIKTLSGSIIQLQKYLIGDDLKKFECIDCSHILINPKLIRSNFINKIVSLKILSCDILQILDFANLSKLVIVSTCDLGFESTFLKNLLKLKTLLKLQTVVLYMKSASQNFLKQIEKWCQTHQNIFVGIGVLQEVRFDKPDTQNFQIVSFDIKNEISLNFETKKENENIQKITRKIEQLDNLEFGELLFEMSKNENKKLRLEITKNLVEEFNFSTTCFDCLELQVMNGKHLKFSSNSKIHNLSIETKKCLIDLKTIFLNKNIVILKINGEVLLDKTEKSELFFKAPKHILAMSSNIKNSQRVYYDFSNNFSCLTQLELISLNDTFDLKDFENLEEIKIECLAKTKCHINLPHKYKTHLFHCSPFRDEIMNYRRALFVKSLKAKITFERLEEFSDIQIEGNIEELNLEKCKECVILKVLSNAKLTQIVPYTFDYTLWVNKVFKGTVFGYGKSKVLMTKELVLTGNIIVVNEIAHSNTTRLEEQSVIYYNVGKYSHIKIDSKYINKITGISFGEKNFDCTVQKSERVKKEVEVNQNVVIGKDVGVVSKRDEKSVFVCQKQKNENKVGGKGGVKGFGISSNTKKGLYKTSEDEYEEDDMEYEEEDLKEEEKKYLI
ncbi:hypothetical protein EIN_400980 [Entamoeba invadens IP1]|uniref:Uncharacterized protein n=1 Tax=Entamoeba invadens IP1 TaxID=370355 RepID=A0A0A1UA86_ENTIV|nr:hypothetical protein EIN_400980 [Entamoeba invadens IP1]ELP91958.1 hypothetical protein EIN_400980 [Entamoeba invadens IP1]|eukprot:XP_004258729.1 hypothetical protein EIN_400980 [Entamoeba invadens IP1]